MQTELFSSDIFLGVQYFLTNNIYWGGITILITVLSGWLVAYHSLFKSSRYKNKGSRSIPVILCHIFLFGPLLHFWELLKNPFRPDTDRDNDIFKLRLLEGTTEAAPQVIQKDEDFPFLTTPRQLFLQKMKIFKNAIFFVLNAPGS